MFTWSFLAIFANVTENGIKLPLYKRVDLLEEMVCKQNHFTSIHVWLFQLSVFFRKLTLTLSLFHQVLKFLWPNDRGWKWKRRGEEARKSIPVENQ